MNEPVIAVNDRFVDKDRGQTLKVLHVVAAGVEGVSRGGAWCVTRGGKLTTVSLDRLSDEARYERVQEAPTVGSMNAGAQESAHG